MKKYKPALPGVQTVVEETLAKTPSTKELIQSDRRERRLQGDVVSLRKKYNSVLDLLHRQEMEINALLAIGEDTETHEIQPYYGTNTSEATAVVLASDWHIEEEVKASKTNNLNKYNLDIAEKRATEFFQRIVRFTRKEQQDVKIKELVLFFGGDFISSNIHEELLANCLLAPVEAIRQARKLLESGITFLLNNTSLNITIICHVGNHSRITKKVFISAEQENSLEYGMYHVLSERFSDKKRIRFIIAEGYHTYFDIYGKTHRFHHGHSVRYAGGVGGLTIPLNKAIAQWNKGRTAVHDAMGHWHNYMDMQNFVVNGSLIGHNAFAISIKADYQPPMQAYYLVDKKRGKTVRIPIMFSI